MGRPSGPVLYVGHYLDQHLRRWNGTGWLTMPNMSDAVRAMTLFDDGGGEALIAGGDFTSVEGGFTLTRVGAWDGSSWSALGVHDRTYPGSSVLGLGVINESRVAIEIGHNARGPGGH